MTSMSYCLKSFIHRDANPERSYKKKMSERSDEILYRERTRACQKACNIEMSLLKDGYNGFDFGSSLDPRTSLH